MGWLIDYINAYNLWDELYSVYGQMVVIELTNYIYNESITNHLKYHYWEQLNILEVYDGHK